MPLIGKGNQACSIRVSKLADSRLALERQENYKFQLFPPHTQLTTRACISWKIQRDNFSHNHTFAKQLKIA